jgi:hypothetical protein
LYIRKPAVSCSQIIPNEDRRQGNLDQKIFAGIKSRSVNECVPADDVKKTKRMGEVLLQRMQDVKTADADEKLDYDSYSPWHTTAALGRTVGYGASWCLSLGLLVVAL